LCISERRSKLLGIDAPVPVAVEGLSEREFAEQAAALLEVTGIRPLAELAAPVLPPQQRAERSPMNRGKSMTQTGRI
jgi:hypothetical protein